MTDKIKTVIKVAALAYVILLSIGAVACMFALRSRGREISRLEGNQRNLLTECRTWEDVNRRKVIEVKQLELKLSECRATLELNEGLRNSQKDIIDAMGVKLRRLESLQQTMLVTTVDTTARIIEAPFIPDTLTAATPKDSARTSSLVEWSDPWVSLSVRVEGEGAQVHLSTVDTIYQVVHRVPYRLLGFIPIGTKELKQYMTSTNPHTTIVYSENIKIGR